MIFPDDVPGWLQECEGRRLSELAAGRVVLEIGSYKGRSTICMAQTARVVHCIDWFRGDPGAGYGWFLPEFCEWTAKYNVTSNIVVHVGRTEDMAKVFSDGVFDLVFVDGAHDYLSVVKDLRFASIVCRELIAVHDEHYHDIRKATTEILGWTGGEEVVGSLKIGRTPGLFGSAEAG